MYSIYLYDQRLNSALSGVTLLRGLLQNLYSTVYRIELLAPRDPRLADDDDVYTVKIYADRSEWEGIRSLCETLDADQVIELSE